MLVSFTETHSDSPIKISDARIALSVEQAAEATSLSKSHLRNEIKAGNLRASRVGKRVLIMRDVLERYIRGEAIQN